MSNNNNKGCTICYNKNTNDLLKCKQCKNCCCDICFGGIIFRNEKFNKDYIENKTLYCCPFCKFNNVFSTKINNYNTNDKLIKLLINKNEYKVQTFNNNNNIIHFNNQLIDEIDILKDKIQKQKKEISDLNKTKNDSQKYLKIVEIIKNTKRKTLLYMDVKDIIKS